MRILQPTTLEGSQWLVPTSLRDADTVRDVSGAGAGPSWSPPAFTLLDVDDLGRARTYADCPWVGEHVLAFRGAVRVRAEALLAEDGEFLPLTVKADEFAVFNALRSYDALDVNGSTIAYGRRTGKIIAIESYAFRDGVLPRRAAFRIPQEPLGTLFTEELADDLLALDLAGLRLEPVGTAEPA